MPNPISFSISMRPDLALSVLFLLIYIVTALYASAVPQGNRRWWALAGLMGVLVLIALQMQAAIFRVVLLDLAALSAVALVWTQPSAKARSAARGYLAMMLVAIVCVAAGLLLGGEQAAPPAYPLNKLAAGLIIVGFAVKLALVPFYFWLPGVAGSSSPMTTALIVATLDIAEFGELFSLRQAAAWIFTEHATLWITIALLSMFVGALLALAQHDLKRMLAFSTIDDMGYLLLGVAIGTNISMTGAFLGMLSHALFKVLMFGAVGIAERTVGEPINLDCRGLATRFPVSSAMFITGALGILGIPPLFGFAGRWRLYLAGVQAGGLGLGILMAAATGLALLYYVRAIHKVWLGRAPGILTRAPGDEPRLASAALIVLAVLGLVLGLFPGLIRLVI